MQIGLTMFPTDYSIGPVELARAAEERGFEALLFPEHTHIPASRITPPPRGGELPEHYWHTLDPFAAIGAAAAATSSIQLGTGVCLVIERDPITTAKEVATVDLISKGRFLFGVGGGWNREEMKNHGTDPVTRFKLMRERIEAMKAIWSEEEGSYHGEFVSFEKIWQWPKPVQSPHPPILVGGDAPLTLPRVLRYGDEWMPNAAIGPARLVERKAELAALAAEAGREPPPVSLFGCPVQPAAAETYGKAGLKRLFFMLPSAPEDTALRLMDEALKVRRQVFG